MAFLTPCFVRVEDPAERNNLIEWLKGIGYKDFGRYMYCSNSDTIFTTFTGLPVIIYTPIDDSWIDCGTSVELFRALAAMNDENCLEQWFTDGQNWGFCKDKYWAVQVAEWDVEGNDDMLEMAISTQCRKATAEEIVEYFKKRDK